eukprot:bmy_04345T0
MVVGRYDTEKTLTPMKELADKTPLSRTKLKYLAFFCKRVTNWSPGPYLVRPQSHPLADGRGMPPTRPSKARLPWLLVVLDGIPRPMTRKSRRLFLLPSRLCVRRLREGLSTWGARIRRLAGSTEVTTTLEEKRKKAKILYWKREQLTRLQKQAEKNVQKKTSRSTEILKTQGLLV